MNLHAEIRSTVKDLPKALKDVVPAVDFAENEEADTVSYELPPLKAVQAIAADLADEGEEVLVTIAVHETLAGDGFRPKHISLTVSACNPGQV